MLRAREPTSLMLLGRMLGALTLKSRSWERAHVVPLRARSNSGVTSRTNSWLAVFISQAA
jgi:hypothetical protein